MVSPLRLSIVASGLLCLIYGSGCASHRAPDELANAVAIGERSVAMSGDATFFGGKLHVVATVSRGIGRGTSPGKIGKGSGRNKAAETPDISGMEDDEAMAYMRAKNAVGSPMPPVTLHLKIENLSGGVLTVEVQDFDSDLGNFAVHPGTLAIAPSQIAEPDPMISQMGVTSDSIPVKITLKLSGTKETQTVMVKSILQKAP